MRKIYKLTAAEVKEFRDLQPVEGKAFNFWKKVAADRGLDYKTIIGIIDGDSIVAGRTYRFSALPISKAKRKKPWCYPMPLKCTSDPKQVTANFRISGPQPA